jgi:hypothetical protein
MYEKGEIFLTPAQRGRIELQNKWEKMLHGEYHHVILIDNKGAKVPVDPLIPIPTLLSEISADLLFGEFPTLDFGNTDMNKKVEAFLPFDFPTQAIESATYVSAIGTMFCYLFKAQDQDRVNWSWIRSNRCVWEIDPITKKLKAFLIFTDVSEPNEHFNSFAIQEHRITEGRYVIWEYTIKVRKADNVVESREMTAEKRIVPFDFIPVVKIDNLGSFNSVIGKSDYSGVEQLFAELDNRMDQINNVLSEHAEPWVALPSGVLDQNGQFNRKNGKMFERLAGDESNISITAWDAQLSSAFDAVDKMIELILFTRRISPALAGYTKGGFAESGRALKWRMISTLSMIQRKRRYWDQFFRQFFEFLFAMEPTLKGMSADALKPRWQDGLPLDQTEEMSNVTSAVNAGLMSKKTGIVKTQEVDLDKAQVELDQINLEQQKEADIENTKFRI